MTLPAQTYPDAEDIIFTDGKTDGVITCITILLLVAVGELTQKQAAG